MTLTPQNFIVRVHLFLDIWGRGSFYQTFAKAMPVAPCTAIALNEQLIYVNYAGHTICYIHIFGSNLLSRNGVHVTDIAGFEHHWQQTCLIDWSQCLWCMCIMLLCRLFNPITLMLQSNTLFNHPQLHPNYAEKTCDSAYIKLNLELTSEKWYHQYQVQWYLLSIYCLRYVTHFHSISVSLPAISASHS